jgi:hypothetical protein
MRGRVKGVMGALVVKSGFCVLPPLQGFNPERALPGRLGKASDGVENVRRIGAPVIVQAQLAVFLFVLPEPAGIVARLIQSVAGDGRLDSFDQRLEIMHRQYRP